MFTNLKKSLFAGCVITLVGISVYMHAEAKPETVVDLKKDNAHLKRKIAFLEDKAFSMQFERGRVEEAKNLYERIYQLQLEIDEINSKLEKLEPFNKE